MSKTYCNELEYHRTALGKKSTHLKDGKKKSNFDLKK